MDYDVPSLSDASDSSDSTVSEETNSKINDVMGKQPAK